MKKGLIYIVKNTINDKVYIGQTTLHVSDRWKAHIKPSTRKKRSSYKLYNAMNKYGLDNFYYEVLEDDIPEDILNQKEIGYIEQYNSFYNGYNSTKGGDGRVISKIEDELSVVNKVLNGETCVSIAHEFGVHVETIKRLLKKHGVRPIDMIIADEEKVIDLYEKNHTYSEIAKIMGINPRTISRVLKRKNIETRKPRFDYNEESVNSILQDIQSGLKTCDIMKKHNIGHYIFYKIKEKGEIK